MVAGENNAGLGGQHLRPALQKHSWSNQPSTPTQTFRTWMKDFKCDEIAPWRWRQGSLQLSLPASAETTSQAHKIKQFGGKLCCKSGAWDLNMRHNNGSGDVVHCRCEENLNKMIWKQRGGHWNLHQQMAEPSCLVQFAVRPCFTK